MILNCGPAHVCVSNFFLHQSMRECAPNHFVIFNIGVVFSINWFWRISKMPRTKETLREFYCRIKKTFKNVFRSDDSVLFCLVCNDKVNARQMSQVTQHLKTIEHLNAIKRRERNGVSNSQSLLTAFNENSDPNRKTSEFAMDLATCFLKANIPLYKIRNPNIVNFFEKHTKHAVPSEYVLRSKCLPLIYEKCLEKMKGIAAEQYIWISVDESTDSEQRFVANFVFGVLGVESERGRSYLFSSIVLDAVNHSTVATFVDESLKELSE